MAIVDGGGDLAEDAPRFRLRQNFALTEVVVEFAAGRVFHDEDHLLLVLKHFVDVDDVGVADGRHDLDLATDADQIRFRFNFRFLNRLDGHLHS